MALRKLMDENLIHYIVTQNIDGLHLKSGIDRSKISELHGNMFIDQCNICKRYIFLLNMRIFDLLQYFRQFTRQSPTPTVGQKYVGSPCPSEQSKGRPCRGKLHDTILDWEHSLPDDDLEMADMHSRFRVQIEV
jgi:NAD+-dependent protein deacetylase sirtuin 6